MQDEDRRQQLQTRVAQAQAEAERTPRSAIPYLRLAHAYQQLAALDADLCERAPLPDAAYADRIYPELPPVGPPLLRQTRHWLRCQLDVWQKLVELEPDNAIYRASLFETLDCLDDIELPLSLFAGDQIDAVLAGLHHPEGRDAGSAEHPLFGVTLGEIDAGLDALHPGVGAASGRITPPSRHGIWSHFFAIRKPEGNSGHGWSAAIVLAGVDHPAVDLRLERWATAVACRQDAPAAKVAALAAALRLHGCARIRELLPLDVRVLAWVTQRADRFSTLWAELTARRAESPTAIDCALLAELAATQAPSDRRSLLEPLPVRSWLDRASIAKGLGGPPPPCVRTGDAVPRWLPAVSAAELRDPLTGAFVPAVLQEDPRLWPLGEWRTTLAPGCPIEVVMLDINCFKNTNNRFGHPVGDDVLRGLVDYLHREVGDRVVRRSGQDEFWIFWEAGGGPALAAHLVEAIRESKWTSPRIEAPWTHASITVSAGAASGASLAEAKQRAEAALREAKHKGARAHNHDD